VEPTTVIAKTAALVETAKVAAERVFGIATEPFALLVEIVAAEPSRVVDQPAFGFLVLVVF
jgi:hypothetical protein